MPISSYRCRSARGIWPPLCEYAFLLGVLCGECPDDRLLFVHGGPSGVGWTAYAPLSALKDADSGSGAGLDLWISSLAFFIVSTLMGGINYISTILNMRTKGMSMTRLPLSVWGLLFTAIMGLLSFPVLLAAFVMLLLDRNAGTSFFLSDIFMTSTARALPYEGGSAILYQHLFWFLGHPEVYIVIFPAFGIVSEVMSVNSRKPIFGYTAMVYSMFAILSLSFMVWAHHMFVSGLNPFLGSVFVLFTLLIAVPSAIKVFNWLTTLWRGNIRFTPAMLFAIGFVSTFISGGLTGIFLGNSTLDIQLHDTYFVIAHFHLVMGVSAVFGMFAGVYHWFPKMFGRFMDPVVGYIHFWVTLCAVYFIFWPMYYEGLAGMPRRYFDFGGWVSFNQWDKLNVFISSMAFLGFFAQLLFVANFFHSIFRGERLKEKNPWQANTLEWTTPIRPGHGNWPGEIPRCSGVPTNIQKMEGNSSRRMSSRVRLVVTFLTFRPADILNSDGIHPARGHAAGKFIIYGVEPVAFAGAVGEIDLCGPVAVDTPAHAQWCELADLVHLLNGSVTGLALDPAGVNVLGMAEKDVVGKIVDPYPFDGMSGLCVFSFIGVVAGVAI
ncbi:cytochrome c oxidase subunit I [Puia sp. P3]|uniref:cytochrome c oxidase subunit I n=1 Tax=Puia sp. P3 TaxID=3423952 RepID=UPI003D67FA42